MNTRLMASDEVTDGIAAIEMHRQGTEKESGLAAACTEALKKLHDLLAQEKEALQLHGPDTVGAVNVEVVENEIKRVQAMAGIKGRGAKGQGAMFKNAHGRERQMQRPDKSHNPPRNRGRRTMGRSGGRGGRGGNSGGNSGGGAGGR